MEDKEQASTHSGAEKGGKNRALALSPERRTDIARQAAIARWIKESESGKGEGAIPVAKYPGTIVLGDSPLPCAVLNTGMRVLSERGVTKALGGKRGGSHWRRQHAAPSDSYLPVFLSAGNLSPFISPSLRVALGNPVLYRAKNGKIGYGVPATLLAEICRVFRRADRANALVGDQKQLAVQAEILYDGFAEVGITALIDEATGYQEVRDRDDLYRILEAYISKELLPWTKRFPNEFYRELFRLRGWSYSPPSPKRPQLVGKLTNQLIYEKLPPGVLDALRQKNPIVEGGYRRYKHHQLLTEDVGDKNLAAQLVAVTTLMKVSRNWNSFKKLFDRAFQSSGYQYEMMLGDLEESDEEEDEDD
ncbi:MAG: hypothetical protein HW388_887 [Dehalococcoidia bacterium]|nr:hypothetical protein [Dehalococcoidia bacterium]